jgi:hypothetical protein
VYTDFLNLQEQMKLQHFIAIETNERFDAVSSKILNLEHMLKDFTHKEHCAKNPQRQTNLFVTQI